MLRSYCNLVLALWIALLAPTRCAYIVPDSLDGAALLQTKSSTGRTVDFAVGPRNARQEQIVKMMRHAWKGYKNSCWGQDELRPLDGTCSNGWNLGLTLIDSLDTLYLMGLDDEFKAGRNWVANRSALDFDKVGDVSLFESTIRILGGLLSAQALSKDHIFLDRAQEFAERVLPAFAGIQSGAPPTSDVDVGQRKGVELKDPFVAESTTLSLEFKTLSELSGDPKYARLVTDVDEHVHQQPKLHGLAPNVIGRDGHLYGPYKLGAGGDSYYEYLLKQWLLTGKREPQFLKDYEEAMDGIQEFLVKKTEGPLQLTYVAEMTGDTVDRKMDHLVCFLPGTLALGAKYGAEAGSGAMGHLDLAKELMRTCYQMYKANGHALGPEIAKFDTEGQELYVEPRDSHDLLRPETVESLFYLYRITGDKKYQDWGWNIANGIEKYAKVRTGGYASLDSVSNLRKRNDMESFFTAETLKYLFLLFDDSRTQVPLDGFVFNTEGHPLQMIGEGVL